MMLFLYNISIKVYYFLILVSSLFSVKAKAWVNGRKQLLKRINSEVDTSSKHIWFHFASLGEFEQGRPVLEKTKEKYPQKKIVITFFSPSGYEIRKNYPLADHVYYLPLDTPSNAATFIDLINPEFAIFTKYDYWLNYFLELKKRRINLYVISAIFYPQFSFFKWYGFINRKMLALVTTIFVQDANSKHLLEGIGINNVIVNGDTRFDRVAENAAAPKTITQARDFAAGSAVLVAGSTWPEDEVLLAQLSSAYPHWKFIIAPHEINEQHLNQLRTTFRGALFYSDIAKTGIKDAQILVIDNIGMLSSLYQYSDAAYIGGGFGAGIHNTLEAAAFGVPVLFGPNYERFREATGLVELKAAVGIKDLEELKTAFEKFQDAEFRKASGKVAGQYVRENTGATEEVLKVVVGCEM